MFKPKETHEFQATEHKLKMLENLYFHTDTANPSEFKKEVIAKMGDEFPDVKYMNARELGSIITAVENNYRRALELFNGLITGAEDAAELEELAVEAIKKRSEAEFKHYPQEKVEILLQAKLDLTIKFLPVAVSRMGGFAVWKSGFGEQKIEEPAPEPEEPEIEEPEEVEAEELVPETEEIPENEIEFVEEEPEE